MRGACAHLEDVLRDVAQVEEAEELAQVAVADHRAVLHQLARASFFSGDQLVPPLMKWNHHFVSMDL